MDSTAKIQGKFYGTFRVFRKRGTREAKGEVITPFSIFGWGMNATRVRDIRIVLKLNALKCLSSRPKT